MNSKQQKRRRYLERRLAPLDLREAMTRARLVVNDFHPCASATELHRWRKAQQDLIEAAIAVGRAIEHETERVKDRCFEGLMRGLAPAPDAAKGA